MICRSLGRREQRKQQTRRALVDAALRLVHEHGLDQVTIEMITEAADVSPRTFFNYFSSKDDALMSIEELEGVLEALKARPPEESPLQALRAAIEEFVLVVGENADQWLMRTEMVKAHPHLKARMVGVMQPLEEAMAAIIASRAGLDPQRDVYPAFVSGAALTAARVALQHWFSGGRREPIEHCLHHCFDLLAQGLELPDAPAATQITPPDQT